MQVAAAVAAAGLESLTSVRVIHCAHAFGVVLAGAAGWKLAFSGDTRPCDALAEAAAGATLLIHEATFEVLRVSPHSMMPPNGKTGRA